MGEPLDVLGYGQVCLEGFTPATLVWLGTIVEAVWGHPEGSVAKPPWVSVCEAAGLVFFLRALPEEEFPGGKWATVQHLEGLVERAFRRAGDS